MEGNVRGRVANGARNRAHARHTDALLLGSCLLHQRRNRAFGRSGPNRTHGRGNHPSAGRSERHRRIHQQGPGSRHRDVEPTANPVPLEAYLRPDVPETPLTQAEATAAPRSPRPACSSHRAFWDRSDMSTTELVKLSAAEMAAKIKAKEVSSRELVEAHLAVIESAEPSVKAFLKVSADQALEQADAFDAKSDEDKAQMPELAGVPIAIKDMIVTKASKPPQPPRSSKAGCRRTTPPSSRSSRPRACRCWARPTSMNSRKAPPPSTPPTRPPTIRGIPSACRAVPAAVPQPQWPHSKLRSPWVPTPAAPSASRAR